MHVVRDKIKDKIKGKLLDQLSLAKTDSEDKKQDDLKLDLTSSTLEPNGLSTGRESLIQQKLKRIKQEAGEKSSYRVTGGGAKRETTRFDEVAVNFVI